MAAFEISVREWAERQKDGVEVAVKRVVLEMATRIVVRSPVDTGRFRGNWRVYETTLGPVSAVGADVAAEASKTGDYAAAVANVDPTGQRTIDEIRATLAAGKLVRRWTISNNLPYAQALERGHSKQAPLGMVALTAMEFRPIVDGVAAGLDSISAAGVEL